MDFFSIFPMSKKKHDAHGIKSTDKEKLSLHKWSMTLGTLGQQESRMWVSEPASMWNWSHPTKHNLERKKENTWREEKALSQCNLQWLKGIGWFLRWEHFWFHGCTITHSKSTYFCSPSGPLYDSKFKTKCNKQKYSWTSSRTEPVNILKFQENLI